MTKNYKFTRLGMLVAMLLLPLLALAQGLANVTVKGSVKDENGDPIVGASVVVKDSRVGAISDVDGNYTFTSNITEGAHVLVVTFVGYALKSEAFDVSASGGAISKDFTLSPDALNLDEVLVTGSSPTTTRRQLGNSISVVKAEDLNNTGSTNALGALQGKVMGAQISQNSGDPAGGFSVRLRGAGSVNSSSDPLYIVDGVIVDNSSQNVINRSADAQATNFAAGQNRLVDLNPNDIDRVEVLNGAAAAAQYGSRAANGVIQIFTKRGKSGKTQIEFSTTVSMSELRKEIPMSDYGFRYGTVGDPVRYNSAKDRLTLLNTVGYPVAGGLTGTRGVFAGFKAAGINGVVVGNGFTAAGLPDSNARRALITDKYPVTRYNYWKDLFQQAIGTESNLSFSGGTEKSHVYMSLGYTNQDGIMKNTNFKKYTARVNADQELASWAKVQLNLAMNFSKSQDMPNGNNFFNPISGVFIIDNIWDLNTRDKNNNLLPVELVRVNPLSIIETFDISQRTNRAIGNVKLSLYPVKGLSLDFIGGGDLYTLTGNEYHPRLPYFDAAAGNVSTDFFPDGYVAVSQSSVMLANHDFLAAYNTNITSDISSTTTAGYQIQYQRNEFTSQEGRDLVPYGTTLSAANNLFNRFAQSRSERLVSGYFVQQMFGYKEQLFLTVAGRTDKSSVFAKDQQNNFYPKVSGSWVISDYWKNNPLSKILSSAKIRAAWGQAGNLTGIGAYDRFDNYGLSAYAGNSSVLPSTVFANATVRPEKMTETEFGADLALFANKVGLSFNIYNQKVTDLLLTKPVPPTVGGSSIITNVSADSTYLSNQGFELMLNFNIIKTKKLSWEAGLIYNTNQNRVYGVDGGFISLRGGGGTQAVVTGQPYGVFYGRYYAKDAAGNKLLTDQGLFQPERGVQSTVEAGTPARFDSGLQNGQPKGTELQKIIGDPNPKWTGSFTTNLTYDKFTFNVLLDAVYGFSIYNWNRVTANNVGWGPLADKELKGEVNRGTVASIAGGINGQRIQEEHVEDGSFVKIREIGLSYSFGGIKGAFENLSVGFSGRNLISFDNYLGFDPETNSAGQSDRVRGDDFGAMPIPRSYMLRVAVKF